MAEIMNPSIVGQYQQGQQIGREFRAQDEARDRRSMLSQLASQAYGTRGDERAGLVRQAIATDPAAGFELEDTLQGLEDAGQKRLIQSARFLMAAPERDREAIYQQIKPGLSEAFPGIQLPANYDQTVAETATALGSAYGPGQQADSVVVGGALVDRATGRPIYTAPQRYMTEQGLIEVTPEGAREVRLGAAAPAPSARAAGARVQGPGGEFGVYTIGDDGRPVFVADNIDPAVRAQLLGGQEGQFATQDTVPQFTAPGGMGDGTRITPAVSGVQREQLELARQSAERAAAADARAAREADIRNRFGTIPAGFRVNAEGTGLEAVPGGPKPAGSAASEDERKAAGWLQQARRAVDNMASAIQDDPGADTPGFLESYAGIAVPERFEQEVQNRFRSDARQRFENASQSLSEAILRAATGAGVNENEARQKVRELVPQRGDSAAVREQKMRGAEGYLQDLSVRAGRAATQQGSQGGGQPARPTTEAQYNALPSGALFVDPDDGRTYRKP